MAKNTTQPSGLNALKAALKEKKFERLYIFYGEEVFLLHHYLEQIKKNLVDDLTESFNYHRFNEESFDVQALTDAVENYPMMSEHTFVWVDDVDIFKLPEPDRNRLAELLSDIPEYCTVVFSYITVSWNPDKRSEKLAEAIDRCSTLVCFSKQEPRDLIPWVTRHFAAENKRISPDLCNYLIDITGGSMTLLRGEIRKICAYSGAEQIVKSDIDAVTEPVLDAVIYQMTDYLAQGNYGGALHKLHQLLKMQNEPLMILGAIGAHFRRMSVARNLIDNGRNTSALMEICGISEYPAKKTMQSAGRFSTGVYYAVQNLILETDHKIKTSFDDPERLLETLVLRIAQEASRD